MPDRTPAAESSYQEDSADSGYFASLSPVRHMMLTTFQPDGKQESAVVHGAADGGQVYFRAWSRSGTVKNLRHNEEVQVAPCGALGFLLLAPPVDAVARRLSDEEASRVAGKLARRYRVQQRFLIPLLHRARRQQLVHYELLSYEAAAAAHAQRAPSVPDRSATDPPGNEPGAVRVTVVRNPGPFPWP